MITLCANKFPLSAAAAPFNRWSPQPGGHGSVADHRALVNKNTLRSVGNLSVLQCPTLSAARTELLVLGC